MKLTSEQKEAERVKFIEVHKLYAGYLERNERGPESENKYISNFGEYYTNPVQAWMNIP